MEQIATTTFRLDIVSDIVCPWCIVGYKQVERALSDAGFQADIHWHPFELNPHMATEGENLRDHLAAKYGTTPEDSVKARERLTAIGEELGFAFNYTDDMRMYNTFKAHQLLHWAETQGRQHDLKIALFSAFFTDRRDVSNPEVLADVAVSVGLDRDSALAILGDSRFADDVRRHQQFWTSRGIQGVPAVVINQRHLVTGAQGAENYAAIFRQLAESAEVRSSTNDR